METKERRVIGADGKGGWVVATGEIEGDGIKELEIVSYGFDLRERERRN